MGTEKTDNVMKSEYMKMVRDKLQYMSNRHEEFLGNGSPVERLTSGDSLVCPSRRLTKQKRKRETKS